MGRLFGTDGVRGVWGSTLTPELLLRLARAIGSYFGRGARVLVGRDTRAGGHVAEQLVVAGLMYEGVKVYLAGITPTPALQLYIRDHGYDGGVMITASHNPPEFNGIKVLGPDGIEVSREDEKAIEDIFFEARFGGSDWRGLTSAPTSEPGVNDYYVSRIAGSVDSDTIRRLEARVVVDCGNGATSLTTPLIVKAVGARPLTLNCNPDPSFPGRQPEPTPESLEHASSLVAASKAVMGVGHDADGDRAIIIDSGGKAHWGDRSGSLLALYIHEHGLVNAPPRVYTAVSSSVLVEEFLKPAGIEVVWTPVGAVNISYAMKREPGIAGFEDNGGYIHPAHQLVRDGGMKTALFLEMLARERGDSSSLFSRLPQYYAVKRKVPVGSREEAECYVREAEKALAGLRLITIDGVKAIGDGFWVLVRPSGTEPVVRIMVEAREPSKAEELAKNLELDLSQRCAPAERGKASSP